MKKFVTFVTILLMLFMSFGCSTSEGSVTVVEWNINAEISITVNDWSGKPSEFLEGNIPSGETLIREGFVFSGWAKTADATEALSNADIVKAVKDENHKDFFAVWLKTGSPYKAYNGQGVLQFETADMWEAIIKAGRSSMSSNRWRVEDNSKSTVFAYAPSSYYMYRGEEYIGSVSDLKEAKTWAAQYADSYVIDGRAQKFEFIGENLLPGSKIHTDPLVEGFNGEFGRELESGSYLYLFSDRYNVGSLDNGYAYVEFTLRFSEAKMSYHNGETEKGWNAYVFANVKMDSPFENCDIGIMNGWENYRGEWYPVFNHNGTMIAPRTEKPITVMTPDENGIYSGADDLKFVIMGTDTHYYMSIINMTTGEEFVFTQEMTQRAKDNLNRFYIVLAASYCPVTGNSPIWSPRNGASFTGVRFEDVKIARHVRFATDSSSYDSAVKEDFLPDEPNLALALMYGGDCGNITWGKEAGKSYFSVDINYRSVSER